MEPAAEWIGARVQRLLDACYLLLVLLLGQQRAYWLSKRMHLAWSYVPRSPLLYRNIGVISAVAFTTWQVHKLVGCVQEDGDVVKWNVSSLAPLNRRLVYDNGLGNTPIMGWSSWNRFECKINEKIVFRNIDALVKHNLHLFGYNYIIVDDCWAAYKRDKQGNLKSHPRSFPSGMKALADYAHKHGLKFGLYSDAGKRTCIGHRAGSQGHEFQDAKTFASWGVDYLKYDNCFHNGEPSHVRYPIMSEALNKSGRPIFYTTCEWGEDNPAIWAGKYANSWRTSLDVKDRWPRIKLLADDNNRWASYAGPGGWNDPDNLQVGNGRLSLAEYRSHFSVWSLMKAPLIIGCDLRTVKREHLEIYTNLEVIAVNQDALGIQGRKVSKQGRCNCLEVWAGPLSGDRIVVMLWNRYWMRATIRVNGFDLGLQPGVSFRVRDIWKHEDWPRPVQDGFETDVGSHDCEVYVLSNITDTS